MSVYMDHYWFKTPVKTAVEEMKTKMVGPMQCEQMIWSCK